MIQGAGALDDPEGWDGEGEWWGFRMGNTCTPMADSCQSMAKPIQYCKVISLPKNKEKKEKKNKKKIKSRDVTLSTKFHLVKAVIFQ